MLILLLRLVELHGRNIAVVEAQLEYIVNRFVALGCLSGDLELLVKITEVDIGIRHCSHKRKNDGFARLVGAQQVGTRCLGRSPQLPPEVDLPTGIEKKRKVIKSRKRVGSIFNRRGAGVLAHALPAGICAGAYLREQRRAGGCVETEKLFDPGSGDLYVFVFLKTALNQLIKDWVIVLLPPSRIGNSLHILVLNPPRLGHINRGRLIIRSNHAAEEGKGKRQRSDDPTHGLLLLFAAAQPLPARPSPVARASRQHRRWPA